MQSNRNLRNTNSGSLNRNIIIISTVPAHDHWKMRPQDFIKNTIEASQREEEEQKREKSFVRKAGQAIRVTDSDPTGQEKLKEYGRVIEPKWIGGRKTRSVVLRKRNSDVMTENLDVAPGTRGSRDSDGSILFAINDFKIMGD